MDRQAETGAARSLSAVKLVARVAHCLQPVRGSQGIAVGAAWRDPVAPRHRIPGRLCPFDGAVFPHDLDRREGLRGRVLRPVLREDVMHRRGGAASPLSPLRERAPNRGDGI